MLNQIQWDIQKRAVSLTSRPGNLSALSKSFAGGQEVSLHILQRSLGSRLKFVDCKVWEAEHIVSKLGLQQMCYPASAWLWSSGRTGSCLILSPTRLCIAGPQTYKINFTPHVRNIQAFQIDKWQALLLADDCSFVHVNMDITQRAAICIIYFCASVTDHILMCRVSLDQKK